MTERWIQQTTTMAHVYLCNKPAQSAPVPQNLKYNIKKKKKKKTWHIYTMEYYAAIKHDEFTSFAGTWMKLETIIFSKLTQEQETKHCMVSLINGSCTENTWTQGEQHHTPGPIGGKRGGPVGGGGGEG